MKTSKPKSITQSQLAKALGITRQLVAAHMKSGKAPPLHDVDGWIEFLAANGREGSLPKEIRKKIAEQRLRLLSTQADDAEDKRRIRRGELVEYVKVDRFIKELVGTFFFGELERIAAEFPARLKGQDELAIAEEVARQIERIKMNLRTRLETWGGQCQGESGD